MHAVIFDVDGVLIDSYAAHYASWSGIAEELGTTFDEDAFALAFGRTTWEVLEELGGGALDEQGVRAYDARKEAAYRDIITNAFPAMPGAVELIDALASGGIALAVGSSGPRENVHLVLNELERFDRFGAIVTGSDVTRGKPDPQVFQLAARGLAVDPGHCVVIEDAPAGIDAARAAGMAVIGFASTGRTRAELADADFVVEALAEIGVERIESLRAKC
ncbi:MAG: HAD family hydrolase [Planctomycetota bacterium]|jgi:beta-phosphoglucomutase